MTKRAALPLKETVLIDVTYVRALPGAVFHGDPTDDDIEYATRLQKIRTEYENAIDYLRADLLEMGFDSSELARYVANPAAITSCSYR